MADIGSGDGGGNLLTRQFGGLPVWGWAAIAIGAGAIVLVIRRRQSDSSTPVAPEFPIQPASIAEGIPTEQYESLLTILRDLQGLLSRPPPSTTTPPPVTTPPPTSTTPVTKGPGTTFTIPSNFVPANQNGTSAVMGKIMTQFYGVPYTNTSVRTKIWYHPSNAVLNAKYATDWSKLRMGDRVYLPKITV